MWLVQVESSLKGFKQIGQGTDSFKSDFALKNDDSIDGCFSSIFALDFILELAIFFFGFSVSNLNLFNKGLYGFSSLGDLKSSKLSSASTLSGVFSFSNGASPLLLLGSVGLITVFRLSGCAALEI